MIVVFMISAKNVKTIEPKRAGKKPSTSNPGERYPANINNKEFITNVKIPRVKMFIGRVMNTIKGLTKILISAIITVTSIAL